MGRLVHRGLSLAVVLAYFVILVVQLPGPHILFRMLLWVIPLALIWYSEELGDLWMHWNVQVTARSPGWLVATLGWVLLALPLVIFGINHLRGDDLPLAVYIQMF